MSTIYDNWERLVRATLKREELIWLSRQDSLCSSSSSSSSTFFRVPNSIFNINTSNLGRHVSYSHILTATDNLSRKNLLEWGASGDFFVGDSTLSSESRVVIKRVRLRELGQEGLVRELEFYSSDKSHHPRFVPLLGQCLELEDAKFLVYKHMSNGDLGSLHVHSLDLTTRVKIAFGAAEALDHLHRCNPPLVHGNVRASSIFLDDKFEVKLGSMSLVRAQEEARRRNNRVMRLFRLSSRSSGQVSSSATWAYDVYCFGMLLLKLLTGKLEYRPPGNASSQEYLDNVPNIVDPTLTIDEDCREDVWAMAILGISCLDPKPSRRPSMRIVLEKLEYHLMRARSRDKTKNV